MYKSIIVSKQLEITIVTYIIRPEITDLIYYDGKIQKNSFFTTIINFSFTICS
jgi:hypothetical protein